MSTPSVTIHLINRRLGYGAVEQRLVGYSGASWGKSTSRFSPAYGCHYIELTPDEYELCREDIFKAAHLAGRVWEPKVIVQPSVPLPNDVQEFNAGYQDALLDQVAPFDAMRHAYNVGVQFVCDKVKRHDEKMQGTTIEIPDFTQRAEIPVEGGTISMPLVRGYAKPETDDSIDAKTPFLKLRAVANREGVDISACKTNAERSSKINEARKAAA